MAMWHFPPTLNCRRESIVWVKNVKKKVRILRVHFYIMFNFISVDGEISPKFGQQSISPCFGLCTFWGLCSRPWHPKPELDTSTKNQGAILLKSV
jgi:hypothetical protein